MRYDTLDSMIDGKQMKAARALLGMSQPAIAELIGLSVTAYSAIERGASTPRKSNLAKIKTALESAGVEFIDGNDRAGVRLRGP